MPLDIEVLIVGAGLSGLMAGRALTEAGRSVLLLEKGRSVGGRLATRRIGDGRADTGAQFFTARGEEFTAQVNRWIDDGTVFEWSRGWSDGSLVDTRDGHPRYAARNGMNTLAKKVAAGLPARVNVEVQTVTPTAEGWTARDNAGNAYHARALALTAPVPQALGLLKASQVALPADPFAALEDVQYEQNITVILDVEGEVGLPPPGAMQRSHANLIWIADNQRKGISRTTLLTVQASSTYSHALWALTDDEVLRKVKIDLEPMMGGSDWRLKEAQIKRWRYSRPTTTLPGEYLLTDVTIPSGQSLPLLMVGDTWAGAKVEGAYTSGLRGGEALAARLK